MPLPTWHAHLAAVLTVGPVTRVWSVRLEHSRGAERGRVERRVPGASAHARGVTGARDIGSAREALSGARQRPHNTKALCGREGAELRSIGVEQAVLCADGGGRSGRGGGGLAVWVHVRILHNLVRPLQEMALL